MEYRPLTESDLPAVMALIDEAKAHLKRLGIDQWQTGYPDRSTLEGDLAAENGYLLTDEKGPAGYLVVDFGGEASYGDIRGAWKTAGPYAVIHRMVIADRCKGRGLTGGMFAFAERLCLARGIGSIKIDTGAENEAMGHLLEKNGFVRCGTITFDGSDKIAFEKVLY